MPHVDASAWKCKPGGWDKLNTEVYDPVLSAKDFPIIWKDDVYEPEALAQFRKPCQDNDAVHFFVDDYRFECLWNSPERYVDKFTGMTVCSPDFSLYTDWNDNLNRWNHYRKQWVGSYLQSEGVKVIPTVCWSNSLSYDYCFDGIEKGSIVALSTVGCSKASHEFSMGFDEMMRQIDPSMVLCLGQFDKVYRGNMIPNIVQYSWTAKSHRCVKMDAPVQVQQTLPGVFA